jgi:ATP-dependent helicase/nuclease subunit A
VKDYIMQVYRFAQSNPWPSDWIKKCQQELSDLKEESLKDSPWMEFLLHDVHLQAGEWAEQLREAEAVCEIPFPWDGPVRTPVCPTRIQDLCLGLSSDRPVFLVLAYYPSFHF